MSANSITNFIIRIDFPQPLNNTELSAVETSIVQTNSQYSIRETHVIPVKEIIINSNNKAPEIIEKTSDQRIWWSDSRDVKITLMNEAVVYENIGIYKGFKEARIAVKGLLACVEGVTKIGIYNRVGIRYVNNFEFRAQSISDIFDWDSYISNDLTASLSFFEDKRLALRSIQIQELISKKNKDIRFRIQTGMLNKNYPAPIVDKSYLLDIDGYSNISIDRDKLDEIIEVIHDEAKELFKHSLKSDFYHSIVEDANEGN